jgi:hypothetical protein
MVPRAYQSHLVVDFEWGLENTIRKFESVTKLMAASFERVNPQFKGKLDLQRLSFAIDPKAVPPHTTTGFTFERRMNVDYSMNRYFCMAPLRTHDHIQLLKEIEKIWAS